MKKVLVLTKFGEWNESSRIRFYQYYPGLEESGTVIKTVPLFSDSISETFYHSYRSNTFSTLFGSLKRLFVLLIEKKYDVLWLDTEAIPYLPFLFESFILPLDKKLILDLGDATHYKYEKNKRFLTRWILDDKISGLVQRADSIITRNSNLFTYANSVNPGKVVLIPPALHPSLIQKKLSSFSDPEKTEIILGWTGSPYSSRFLYSLYGPLKELSRSFRLKIILIGAEESIDLPIRKTHYQFSREDEMQILDSIDIGLMPLPRSLRETGSSGYKVMKYMARGKAVLASDIGGARDLIHHGENGFLCKNADDWYLSMRLFIESPSNISLYGEKAFQSVKSKNSFDSNLKKIAGEIFS
ncbi:MAG: glycosyltransferase family 4 protein [Leptospiraceae bacterium]|nr:glycosyltransferase family 4 protein [Leptospiraceae bacterium]MCP5512014.1 glycosyltransferase family 4 protein [Leptospiraceae bacterium]